MAQGLDSGLEGVVAAHTHLSDVDGEQGTLIIAGDFVESLSGRVPFEALCARLWGVPTVHLGAARQRAFAHLGALGDALEAPDGMGALRTALSHLPGDASVEDVTAAAGVFAAAWARRRAHEAPLPPDATLPHATDVLRMATGKPAQEALAAGLDAYLVTVMDHGLNASTFTARVIASTGSDLVSSVVGAVGALKGPLHGGAPGPVLDMLEAVGCADQAERWLVAELEAGRRIMGMGHRVYRVRDPRAAALETAVERLERAGVTSARLSLAREVERVAMQVLAKRYPQRALAANVEFYTAVLLDTLGLPRQLFSPLFAVGRVAGWCAHVLEQRATGRLIRPASVYVGSRPV
jgi:citrate synthase